MLMKSAGRGLTIMAEKIDGKAVSAALREHIKSEVAEMEVKPGLAVVIVGDDSASHVYVRNKKRGCEDVGFNSWVYELPAETSESQLLALIDELNVRSDVHGILVQLPLPKHIDESVVTERIVPEKDVDAFHSVNAGRILKGEATLLPCTPAGIMELLKYYGIEARGRRCVVIGRSNIVGKPMALLLLAADGTVTVCHSRTQNLADVTREADILVSAVGRAGFVTGDMIKEGAVVIDVGMNRDGDGKLCGDVDFASAEPKCSYITPVPGGVGPMTITMLLRNTLTAAKNIIKTEVEL